MASRHSNELILISEVLNLTSLQFSISPEFFKFGTTTLDSDRFITICQSFDHQVTVIDLYSRNAMSKHKIPAEAAMMNPVSKILALRAGLNMQIYDLDAKIPIKRISLPEAITYWRWIDESTIGLVSNNSVYHITIDGDTYPMKVFDWYPSLHGAYIMNYQVSQDKKWHLLCGISVGGPGTSPGSVVGHMQMYSADKGTSQMLSGHNGTFTVLQIPDREDTDIAQVVCFEERKTRSSSKLYIKEVSRAQDAPGGSLRIEPTDIPLPVSDFPTAIHCSQKGFVYLLTKLGHLYIFDNFTGKRICDQQIGDTIISSAPHHRSDGVICVNRSGQVIQMSLNHSKVVPFIENSLGDYDLARSISSRLSRYK